MRSNIFSDSDYIEQLLRNTRELKEELKSIKTRLDRLEKIQYELEVITGIDEPEFLPG